MIGKRKEEGRVRSTFYDLFSFRYSLTPSKNLKIATSVSGFKPGSLDRMPLLYYLRHHHCLWVPTGTKRSIGEFQIIAEDARQKVMDSNPVSAKNFLLQNLT